jgi:hypothetical protein
MPADDLWIATRITDARSVHPLVTEAVSTRMKELLSGTLSSRQLPQLELTNVAKALIADMLPAPAQPDAQQ